MKIVYLFFILILFSSCRNQCNLTDFVCTTDVFLNINFLQNGINIFNSSPNTEIEIIESGANVSISNLNEEIIRLDISPNAEFILSVNDVRLQFDIETVELEPDFCCPTTFRISQITLNNETKCRDNECPTLFGGEFITIDI